MLESKPNRYQALISRIFHDHFKNGITEFEFERTELSSNAKKLRIKLPDNLGDIIYSFRYRTSLPDDIVKTATTGKEWIIEPAGRSRYRFKLAGVSRIIPNPELLAIKIPDATPEIIAGNALSDEQALLAKVRYNRLIDIFLGITTYSLQSHLRTTVPNMGQIEIDEVYVGVNRNGQQFVVPVQAKGGTDKLATIQTSQDVACCRQKFPTLTCRPVSAQFMADDIIALFEFAMRGDDVKIAEERHYQLVPADSIQAEDLKTYATR
ncbi:MAG: hypothetical protein WAM04_14490 [Candidatus Sulfotelmatobacter sp.]